MKTKKMLNNITVTNIISSTIINYTNYNMLYLENFKVVPSSIAKIALFGATNAQ